MISPLHYTHFNLPFTTTANSILTYNYPVDLFGYHKLHARGLTFNHKPCSDIINSDAFASLETSSSSQLSHVLVFLFPGKPSQCNLHFLLR